MKGILFFLSTFTIVGCSSNGDSSKVQKFDVIKHLDSVFVLAHQWSNEVPPIPNELLDSLSANMDSVEIYYFDNSIDPQGVLFTAPRKTSLMILEKTPTLQGLNKVSYESYEVWRSIIGGKEILEFSLQPHPVKKWVFSIRKRSQE